MFCASDIPQLVVFTPAHDSETTAYRCPKLCSGYCFWHVSLLLAGHTHNQMSRTNKVSKQSHKWSECFVHSASRATALLNAVVWPCRSYLYLQHQDEKAIDAPADREGDLHTQL